MFLKKLETLRKLLNLQKKDIVTVVGSNGKTTFCLNLCKELKKEKKIVFLTTTVKILPVNKKYEFIDITIPKAENETEEKKGEVFPEMEITSFLLNLEKNLNNSNNVYVLGIYDSKIGKITSLSPKILEDISEKCDYMIIEGDGSKMKPLKGWKKTEPVYTKNTTKSVGILPINIIGNKINDVNIHRMEEFLEISKGQKNETLTLNHLYNVIIHKNGLFQYSLGEKILILNCAERDKDKENALNLAEMIKSNINFKDVRIAVTSLKNREYYEIGENSIIKEENQNFSVPKISAIIMASGKSKRMGTNKLLLEYRGVTFIENTLKKVLNENFYELAIITCDKEVKKKCQNYIKKLEKDKKNIYLVDNKKSEKGQSESIKMGLKTLGKCDGYMFFSCDQPFLTSDTIKKILKNFNPERITIPEYDGKRSLPVIFGKNFKNELLKLEGDTGGKTVINNHPDKIRIVEIENSDEGRDIDTKEDYEMLKKGEQNVHGRNNNKQ
jgi:molybdenum hydroxylase accessory protein, ygfJ family